MSEPLVTYVGSVYPWQCDQVGHMNVTFYMAKFDEASWQLFTHLGMDGAYFRTRKGGMAGVDQHTTYSRELQPGDCVRVTTTLTDARPKRITFRHEMVEVSSGEVAAVCTITAVHIDPETRKSSELAPDVAERALAMLAG